MIEVCKLSKHFGSFKAVDEISFSIPTGQIVGLLGPNGAGKSTTMRMITGFLQPTSGLIKIDGKNIEENAVECKKKIGYMPESAPLYGEMIVDDYLRYVAQIQGQNPDEKVPVLCRECGLKEVMHKNISDLSRGYRQRVGLAHALMNDPEILILDEPTSGLDPVSREDLLDVFLSLKDDGKTILFSTHVTSDLDKCADDITYIRNGKIFASEPTDTFKEKYKLAFVKKDAFTDDIAACSHGVRRLKDVLSVLISADKAAVLNIETTDASLEDIMVHLEKVEL